MSDLHKNSATSIALLRHKLELPTLVPEDVEEAQSDERGRLIVAHSPALVSTNFGTVTKALVQSGPSTLFGFNVAWGGAPTPVFFQVFNKATAPIAGDVPVFSYRIATGASIISGLLAGDGGIAFPLGLGWAWSTTEATFTDGTTPASPTFVTVFYR